jgi:hypothetical protein
VIHGVATQTGHGVGSADQRADPAAGAAAGAGGLGA